MGQMKSVDVSAPQIKKVIGSSSDGVTGGVDLTCLSMRFDKRLRLTKGDWKIRLHCS